MDDKLSKEPVIIEPPLGSNGKLRVMVANGYLAVAGLTVASCDGVKAV